MREVDWLSGQRRFPGELCLPDARIMQVQARIERRAKRHQETQRYISSAS